MAAKSSSVIVTYAEQVDKDTVAVGAFTPLSKRSGGFSSSGEEADTGSSVNRHKAAATLGSVTHTGSFEMDFGADVHDAFIASVLASDWAPDVGSEDSVSIGSTPKYFTFVIDNPHLATAKRYTRYTGVQVVQAGFTFPREGAGVIGLSITLGVAGRDFPATDPRASVNAAPVVNQLKTCNALTVLADAVEIPSVIDSLNFNIASENESVFDIRQCDPVEVLLGDASTDGTLVMLHDDDSDQYHRDAASNTEFDLEIRIDTATTDYRIHSTRTANRATGPDYTNDNITVSVPFGSVISPTIYRTQ